MLVIVLAEELTFWEIGLFPARVTRDVGPSLADGARGADMSAALNLLKAASAEHKVGRRITYLCGFPFCGLFHDDEGDSHTLFRETSPTHSTVIPAKMIHIHT